MEQYARVLVGLEFISIFYINNSAPLELQSIIQIHDFNQICNTFGSRVIEEFINASDNVPISNLYCSEVSTTSKPPNCC